MRLLTLILCAGLLTPAADADKTCNDTDKAIKAKFGSLGAGRCAPVDGLINKQWQADCSIGLYDPKGKYRKNEDEEGNLTPRPHYGVDLSSPIGDPFYAPVDGEVEMIDKNNKQAGLTLVVAHEEDGETIVTRYLHLSETAFDETNLGKVTKGTVLGKTGDDGKTAKGRCPHLHLEVRKDSASGDTRNPLGWLSSAAPKAALAATPQAASVTIPPSAMNSAAPK